MLVLNEEERMLADSAKELIAALSPISAQRQLRDEPTQVRFDNEVWQQFIDMGWPAMPFAEQYDGFDFSAKGLAVIFEHVGANLCASPLLSSVILAGGLIEKHANDELKAKFLPAIMMGKVRLALALDEGKHHNPERIATEYVETNEGYCLSGQKSLVVDAIGADGFIVVAKHQTSKQLQAFYVAQNAPGLSLSQRDLIDSRNYANLQFRNVMVEKSAALSDVPLTLDVLQTALDYARVCVGAEILGACQIVFEQTIDYLKTRVQFGVPIGSFQALQHRAAWLYSELEVARSCVLDACEKLDQLKAGKANISHVVKAVSVCMYKVSVMADKVTSEAIQMHGGIGVTDELDLGLYLKRVRVTQALLGERHYHQSRYAATVLS